MCHLYPYNNVKLLRKFFYINSKYNWQHYSISEIKLHESYLRLRLRLADLPLLLNTDLIVMRHSAMWQYSSPGHRARATVELPRHKTPCFIPSGLKPPNSPVAFWSMRGGVRSTISTVKRSVVYRGRPSTAQTATHQWILFITASTYD